MGTHHTKTAAGQPSQIRPSAASKVALDATLEDTFVVLCDWHGHLVWKSGGSERLQIGDPVWKNVTARSKEKLRTAVANVASLRENCMLDVDNDRNELCRVWLWPLTDPEIAICILGIFIPKELALLTEREKDCLRCLAQGLTTRDIAKELGIGLTTVHTHLRRSREKLGLTTAEALIGFAARYFYPHMPKGAADIASERKRSG
jgi:DNA-binding CsgD family transcriptional regulator